MADKFDPYREALVMETKTIWPDGIGPADAAEKRRIAQRLHAAPKECAELEYVRLTTGFCRQITVTEKDLKELP